MMETMERKKSCARRSFTPELKAEVVALYASRAKTAGDVAREMDLTETAVREWVKQAERDEGVRADGLSSDERAELTRLRKELREAREERDILKRAASFFARKISYFLSTVDLTLTDVPGMSRWRKLLFLATARASSDIADHFRIPGTEPS